MTTYLKKFASRQLFWWALMVAAVFIPICFVQWPDTGAELAAGLILGTVAGRLAHAPADSIARFFRTSFEKTPARRI